jgi:hypothetical protein
VANVVANLHSEGLHAMWQHKAAAAAAAGDGSVGCEHAIAGEKHQHNAD